MYENAGVPDCAQVFERQMKVQPVTNAPALYIRWDRSKFNAHWRWPKDKML